MGTALREEAVCRLPAGFLPLEEDLLAVDDEDLLAVDGFPDERVAMS